MSSKLKSISLKKGKGKMAASGAKAAGDAAIIQDNQDNTFTVQGADASGSAVDISSLATLSVSSSDPSVVTVDPPVGMTGTLHAIKAGHSDLNITATWNDGTFGPFSASLPCDVSHAQGPTSALVITLGVPTVRP